MKKELNQRIQKAEEENEHEGNAIQGLAFIIAFVLFISIIVEIVITIKKNM